MEQNNIKLTVDLPTAAVVEIMRGLMDQQNIRAGNVMPVFDLQPQFMLPPAQPQPQFALPPAALPQPEPAALPATILPEVAEPAMAKPPFSVNKKTLIDSAFYFGLAAVGVGLLWFMVKTRLLPSVQPSPVKVEQPAKQQIVPSPSPQPEPPPNI